MNAFTTIIANGQTVAAPNKKFFVPPSGKGIKTVPNIVSGHEFGFAVVIEHKKKDGFWLLHNFGFN
jgi:hypothetical protein